jgi:voltage-dependent potassium channel beta subunit
MDTKPKPDMVYRFLGKTGIKVSCLGFGNWVNGEQITPELEESTYECMKKCYEAGINYFDTAEMYGFGAAETLMGKAFKRLNLARKDFVVSTKLIRCGNGVNDLMLSRKHIIEGMTASLKRLQLDYVDVVFAHRYDQETPMEEICRAFNWLIEHNKAFYWGTSEWTSQQIMEAIECCERHNLIKPIVEQPEYNLFVRKNMEVELEPIIEKYGFGTTIWSPLAGGLLTGKYNDGDPKDSRYSIKLPGFAEWIRERYTQKDPAACLKKIKEFCVLAESLKGTPAQLALAWVMKNKDVSVCLFGASNAKQVDENVKSLAAMKLWTPEIEKKVEEIFANKPESILNWRTWKPIKPRRESTVKFDGDAEFKN